MFEEQFLMQIVANLGSAPLMLVCLVAVVACVARIVSGRKNGWVVIAAIGFVSAAKVGVNQVFYLVQVIWPEILQPSAAGPNLSFDSLIAVLVILPMSILEAAAWGLILYAAFGPGSGPQSRYLVEE